MTEDSRAKWSAFFQFLFEGQEGWLCLASIGPPPDRKFNEKFFAFPKNLEGALDFLEQRSMQQFNLYFCQGLLRSERRRKENITECGFIWADVDDCKPEKLKLEPTVLIRTSPGRYQAMWKLKQPIPAVDAEKIAARIAHFHKEDGADTSGWDLTQLLRVPLTSNLKYDAIFPVEVVDAEAERVYSSDDFSVYPYVKITLAEDYPLPDELPDREEVLQGFSPNFDTWTEGLLYNEPQGDWSSALWSLELRLLELGMTPEEVFVVVREAAPNKYRRDGRPEEHLWREVCKANQKAKIEEAGPAAFTSEPNRLPELFTEEEREAIRADHTFIEDYVDWAQDCTDAPVEYHHGIAIMVLSSLLSGRIRVPTSFAKLAPNLWMLLIGNTTLSRKSTSMSLGMRLVLEVNKDVVLATDATFEGLLTGLTLRPGQASLFWKDEFTGLLESINRKDYMAGMKESLIKLYDGDAVRKRLAREAIEAHDPVFLILGGATTSRLLQLVSTDLVLSGFLPRFCLIFGHADLQSMKSLVDMAPSNELKRIRLLDYLQDLHDHYQQSPKGREPKSVMLGNPHYWNLSLNKEAWSVYQEFEYKLLAAAEQDLLSALLSPTLQRLSISGLKIAALIAASRQPFTTKPEVQPRDVKKAFYFIERWQHFALEAIEMSEQSPAEQQIHSVYTYIKSRPEGVPKSELYKRFKLTAREGAQVLDTLRQRGDVRVLAQRGGPEILKGT